MSLKDEIKKAIGAHGLWKTRLQSAIESGKSDFAPDHVCRDDQCDFGRWLYGPTMPEAVKRSPEYAACRKLHADFHVQAAGVLRLAISGQKDKALNAMSPVGKFADVSASLTRAMMDWTKSAA